MGNGHIFLIGFMGAGKSSAARAIRNKYGMDYIEMDQQIEDEAGMSVSEIFKRIGEEEFRRMETELIRSLADKEFLVISCGGGVPVRKENVEEMRRQGTVVYLTASPETVFERVRGRHHRPLLEGNMNVDYISGLMDKRREAYEAAADVRVSTEGKTVREIADEIMNLAGAVRERQESDELEQERLYGLD